MTPLADGDLSLTLLVAAFVACAAVIGVAGVRLARVADELADRTGMGEIVAGAVFVGASTSLPGVITSVTTAWNGYAGLAIGNALGGLTAQTAFLAIADLVYRRSNLEHAASSATGLSQATLLVTMLTLPLLAAHGPDVTLWSVHPATVLLFVVYGFGLRQLQHVEASPMWRAVDTELTADEDEQAEAKADDDRSDGRLWTEFGVCATAIAAAGFAIGETSIGLVGATGLSETAVGGVFTAVANSLPELVTAIAAVRMGAVNLAIGDIIGGNAFEVLFLAAADVAYRDGSIYATFTDANSFTAALVILMVGVLLLGMLGRQRRSVGGIGWESATVLGLYAASVAYLLVA